MKIFSLQSLGHFLQFFLMLAGALFLVIESYEVIANQDFSFSWWWYVVASFSTALIAWLIHGFVTDGYMRNRASITSSFLDGSIDIEFGDLLAKDGWKAIGVNDFFDSQVDDVVISANTLHGKTLQTHWKDAIPAWDATVDAELEGLEHQVVEDHIGKDRRYVLGTTVRAIAADGSKFLFVALGRTTLGERTTKANAEDIIVAVRGLLRKARASCSNEPLYIPLIGSGLARTGIKEHLLLQLILIGIIEETKVAKVTSKVTVVLPTHLRNQINLGSINTHWK